MAAWPHVTPSGWQDVTLVGTGASSVASHCLPAGGRRGHSGPHGPWVPYFFSIVPSPPSAHCSRTSVPSSAGPSRVKGTVSRVQSGCPCGSCRAPVGEQCCFSHSHTVHRRCSTCLSTTHSRFCSALRSDFSCWCVQPHHAATPVLVAVTPSCAAPRARAFSHSGAPSELLGFLTATSLTDILSRWVWDELRAAVDVFKNIFS